MSLNSNIISWEILLLLPENNQIRNTLDFNTYKVLPLPWIPRYLFKCFQPKGKNFLMVWHFRLRGKENRSCMCSREDITESYKSFAIWKDSTENEHSWPGHLVKGKSYNRVAKNPQLVQTLWLNIKCFLYWRTAA